MPNMRRIHGSASLDYHQSQRDQKWTTAHCRPPLRQLSWTGSAVTDQPSHWLHRSPPSRTAPALVARRYHASARCPPLPDTVPDTVPLHTVAPCQRLHSRTRTVARQVAPRQRSLPADTAPALVARRYRASAT